MKTRITFSFLLLLLAGTALHAARRPSTGNPGRPILIYTADRIAAAKQLLDTDTARQRAWQTICQTARQGVRSHDIKKLDAMTLAWLMTDSTHYYEGIRETLLRLKDVQTWGSSEMLARQPAWRADLGLAGKTYQTALAYDAVRDRLSSADRKTIVEALYRLSLEPSLGDWVLEPTRIHSLNSMGHNGWTSCACMGGIMALALRDDVPQAKAWAEAENGLH